MTIRVYCKSHGNRVTHDMPINCLNPHNRSAHATKGAYERSYRMLNALNGERLYIIQTPAIKSVTVEDGKHVHIVL